jgi:hypothetical protein
LELLAVHYAILSYLPQLQAARVHLHEDNMGLVYILREKTSKSPVIMRLLRRLCLLLDLNNIQLQVVTHVRSEDNPADAPSREWDFEDWQLHPAVFAELNRRYGPYSLDAFASDSTALLPRFYSKALCPGSLGMDAFSHSWARERLWINPPWDDLHQVAQVLKETPSAMATVLTPYWPSKAWYQELSLIAAQVHVTQVLPSMFLAHHDGVRDLARGPTRLLAIFQIEPGGRSSMDGKAQSVSVDLKGLDAWLEDSFPVDG